MPLLRDDARTALMPFTEAEVGNLIEAARSGAHPQRDLALLLLQLFTRCRVRELLSLALIDVDFADGSIVFRDTKRRRPRGARFRVDSRSDGGACEVAIRTWLAVRTARPGVENLFTSDDGLPLNLRLVERVYTSLGTSAGISNCRSHRMRATRSAAWRGALA